MFKRGAPIALYNFIYWISFWLWFCLLQTSINSKIGKSPSFFNPRTHFPFLVASVSFDGLKCSYFLWPILKVNPTYLTRCVFGQIKVYINPNLLVGYLVCLIFWIDFSKNKHFYVTKDQIHHYLVHHFSIPVFLYRDDSYHSCQKYQRECWIIRQGLGLLHS